MNLSVYGFEAKQMNCLRTIRTEGRNFQNRIYIVLLLHKHIYIKGQGPPENLSIVITWCYI